MPGRFWRRVFRLVALLLGLWLFIDLASHLTAELLWFQELGFLPAFLLRLKTQVELWAIAFFTSAGFLLGNLALAHQFQYPKSQISESVYPLPKKFGLRWLLPVLLVLSVLVGLILLYYGQAALSFWHPNINLPNMLPRLPLPFELVKSQVQLLQLPLPIDIWQVVLLVSLTIAIVVNPQFWLNAIALVLSLLFGFVLSERWDTVLQYFHPTSFNRTEPLFERDISFYVFSLPGWELLEFWLFGLFLYNTAAVGLIYLRSGDSLSQGRFTGFSQRQRCHLVGNGVLLMLAIALRYWLRRYELLYSTHGVNYGASYTAVNVQLPIYTWLSILAVAIAVYLLLRMFVLAAAIRATCKTVPYPPQLIYGLGLYLAVAAVTGSILPTVVHRLVVQPNELARERPYIERTIALTRQGFGLNNIEARTFNPQNQLTATDLQENDQTIRNIRLWDTRPLLQTNRQLQQIRLYYKFLDADIDRYTLSNDMPREAVQAEEQQVILAARELDYSAVPREAQTWVNKHLIYTHGYGFTLSPVNTVSPSGLPEYYVKNIGIGVANSNGALQVSNQRIRDSIPIGAPRIYYGEITDNYVMTGTKFQEFDYPQGDENVYNTYDGRGGVAIGSWWRRLVFAEYLKDWQMLFTRNFTPQTKLLFRRNINQRVRAIAPFLRYDNDPYLVVADANLDSTDATSSSAAPNYLYWIIDAYTTSDRYPYSDPGDHEFNYIRNSVKVVIDAYHGSIVFYVADPDDPIINTWNGIFPGMFKPLSEMPVNLLSHIRYPVDFFSIQSERLLSYHMTDPQVFYNREDQWQVPTEIYGSKPQKVQPYYLIMKLPTAESEEFILLLPFTPTQRNNLIAWLAARSDAENYGKLLIYEFPKQELIYGQEQIEARINQDPVISQQISLWNRQGSRAIQGNLLVIPIERSLLYVEPLYLEAEQNSLPTLVRVIVAYENRIVMAETLNQALHTIFKAEDTTAPAIIRPVEAAPPLE